MDSQGGEIFETGRSGTIAQMSVRVGLKVAGLLAIDEGYERIPVISCDHFGSALRHGLRSVPHQRCAERFHSRSVWRSATARPQTTWPSLLAVRRCHVCAALRRRPQCQPAFSLPLHYVAGDIVQTMLDFGLCRATWDLIGNEFTRPASEQHESIRSHDIVW